MSRSALYIVGVAASVCGVLSALPIPVPPSAQPPSTPSTIQAVDPMSLDRPVYLRKGAVICSQADVLGACLDGYRMGGEVQGHRAVKRLFRYPDAAASGRSSAIRCRCSMPEYPTTSW